MSYDILAFDPTAIDDEGFEAWWAIQSEWTEGHSYSDSTVTTPALRAFYNEIRLQFLPMNGPDAASDDLIDDPTFAAELADYSIGRSLVYAAFPWSAADRARTVFLDAARQHQVAVALVSDDSSITRPR